MPWRAALAVGAALGSIAYRLGVRRRVVWANLARAFPDWSDNERRRVAYETYRNTGRTIIECLMLGSLSPSRLAELVEGVEGEEFIEQAGGVNKSFVVLTGHMGNWELMGAYFAQRGFRLKVFAKPMHNPRIESQLLAARRAFGLDVLYTGEGLKPALRHLREGGALGFLADQDARRAGIAVPFFGVPASTALGPAVFALLGKVPILPIFALRVGSAHHRFVALRPIEPRAGEKREVALEQLTRAHVQALEEMIRKHPEQYFWFHRRWKTPERKLKRGQARSAEKQNAAEDNRNSPGG